MEYKGYSIVGLGTFPVFEIKMKGQGKSPIPLRGVFTTTKEAQKAVDMYLQSLLKKGKRNAKKEVASTN